ncbi:MAG: hypothetical protein GXY40_12525 [Syntrophomonadaceae bacterium]|jgi:hypothetical protein|nr:hypothetical protein [Syntrophomonadaceae bacterium]
MQKRILLATLIILIILWFTRWDVAASKTSDSRVTHWKRDTWTGAIIIEKYRSHEVTKETAQYGIVPIKTATNIWIGLLLINSVWLIYVIKKEGNSSAT